MQAKSTPQRVRATDSKGRPVKGLYLRSDGVYVAGFTLAGKWTMRTLPDAKGLTEAKEAQRRLLTERSDGKVNVSSRMTMADLGADYFNASRGLSVRTEQLYRSRWNTHLKPKLGTMQVQKVSASDVARVLRQMQNGGSSEWTRHGVLTVLGSIFEHARTRGIVTESPTRRLAKAERPKMRNKQKVRKLAPESLAKLLASASPGWRPYIATVAYTGTRASEALALRWQDIDTKAGFVRVNHQLGRDGKLVPLKADGNERGRVIPLTPALRAVLLELRMSSRHKGDIDYVFSTVTGKPRSYYNALRAFNAASKRAGLDGGDERLSLHSLRHTAASLLIRAGVPIVTVSKMLGHSKVSTTLDIYADVIAELDTNLGEEMGAAFAVASASES